MTLAILAGYLFGEILLRYLFWYILNRYKAVLCIYVHVKDNPRFKAHGGHGFPELRADDGRRRTSSARPRAAVRCFRRSSVPPRRALRRPEILRPSSVEIVDCFRLEYSPVFPRLLHQAVSSDIKPSPTVCFQQLLRISTFVACYGSKVVFLPLWFAISTPI